MEVDAGPVVAPSSLVAWYPSLLQDWGARPAPLDPQRHGRNAVLARGPGPAVAQREVGLQEAVVYTQDPLTAGEVWQVTVLATHAQNWREGLVS